MDLNLTLHRLALLAAEAESMKLDPVTSWTSGFSLGATLALASPDEARAILSGLHERLAELGGQPYEIYRAALDDLAARLIAPRPTPETSPQETPT